MTEDLLTRLWFDADNLSRPHRLQDGRELRILDPGQTNPYDGPDLRNVRLLVEGSVISGDAEIHVKALDWKHHGHDQNPQFSKVCLHIVRDPKHWAQIKDAEQNSVPCLVLESPGLFPKPSSDRLACSAQIQAISESVVEEQIKDAANEYFVYLCSRVQGFYDSAQPTLLQSYRIMLIRALFDALGIPANRDYMKQQANLWLGLPSNAEFIAPNKRVRPRSRVSHRVVLARAFCKPLLQMTLTQLCSSEPEALWKALKHQQGLVLSKTQEAIMFHIAFLPAIYTMGSLILDYEVMNRCFRLWKSTPHPIPASIKQILRQSGWPESAIGPDPGLVHQVKRICRAQRCGECRIGRSILGA